MVALVGVMYNFLSMGIIFTWTFVWPPRPSGVSV